MFLERGRYILNHTRKKYQLIASLLFLSSALALVACNDRGTDAGPTPTNSLVIRNPGQQKDKIQNGFHIGSQPYDNIYDECYGGAYINEDDVLVVFLTEDTEENRGRVRGFANASNILFQCCNFSLTELYRARDTLYDNYGLLDEKNIPLHHASVDEEQNRVTVLIQNYKDETVNFVRSLVEPDCLIIENYADKVESWIAKAVKEGRVELSQDWTNGRDPEAYFAEPVQVTKSVQLGDFIYTMTAPKTLFRLSDLQDGTEVIEITTTLTYVGEQDSITISSYDSPFYAGEITDLHGNSDGGGSYSLEAFHTLLRNEPISFTKVYDKYSKRVSAAGPGVIMAFVEFTVLDENEEYTDEAYNYLLAIPYDVLE